jgi:hypothetical protein
VAWFRDWLYGGGDTAAVDEPIEKTAGDPAARGARSGRPAARGRLPGGEAVLPEEGYPGERLGLPEHGPGSVATLARRSAQFVLDTVLAGLVAALFTYPDLPRNWSLLAWAVLVVVPLATIGMTPAMAMLGLRVLRLDRPGALGVGPLWALVRTASVFFVIPALLVDRDVRGLHDRASRTIVVRTR